MGALQSKSQQSIQQSSNASAKGYDVKAGPRAYHMSAHAARLGTRLPSPHRMRHSRKLPLYKYELPYYKYELRIYKYKLRIYKYELLIYKYELSIYKYSNEFRNKAVDLYKHQGLRRVQSGKWNFGGGYNRSAKQEMVVAVWWGRGVWGDVQSVRFYGP